MVAALAVMVTSVSCSTDGLAFREDTRIDIVDPGDRDKVTLPVMVRWTARDVDGSFAVLVDRTPQPPGEPVTWFARNDDTCDRTPGCPDPTYLADRDVFTTDNTTFTVESLPDTVTGGRRREFHEVTVVLLDGDGRRVGESAWSIEFQVERGDAPG